MNIIPVKNGSVNFRKCELLENRLLIGIDSGSSMTKIVFLHKDNKEQLLRGNTDYVTLSNVLFNNEDFEDAIKWTLERAYLSEDRSYSVHITGCGAQSKVDIVESLFHRKAEYIDEMLTIAAGHSIALEQIGLENLLSADVDVENIGKIESKLFQRLIIGMMPKVAKEELDGNCKKSDIFPCLIHVYGSASGFFHFDKNGTGEFSSCLLTGGRSFMGLAKCLLDINNYDEIIRLASKGNRANVDTQAKEFLLDDVDSPYGSFPPEMPLLPFGKCMDFNQGIETFAKEDLALSLISYFALMMVINCSQIAKVKMSHRIYLTGNIFRSDLFKKEIQRILVIYPFIPNCEILDFGYFGALGAMFSSNEESDKFYKS